METNNEQAVPAVPVDALTDELSDTQKHTIGCMDSWARTELMPTYSQLRELAEQYSDMLRKICFEYSAGGYNSEGLMPPATADAKLRWIIGDTSRATSLATPSTAPGEQEQQSQPSCDAALRAAPAVQHGAWIAAGDYQKPTGRTPILVAVSFVRYGEYEDGTPGEWPGQIVAEGEYIPQHGEAGNYFSCYSSPHGDGGSDWITHWMPLPALPTATKEGK